jgi:hypothetical protein
VAWIVRLVSIGAEGEEHSTDVMQIAKPDTLADLGTLGLSLVESKQLLAGTSWRLSSRRPGSMPRTVRSAAAATRYAQPSVCVDVVTGAKRVFQTILAWFAPFPPVVAGRP